MNVELFPLRSYRVITYVWKKLNSGVLKQAKQFISVRCFCCTPMELSFQEQMYSMHSYLKCRTVKVIVQSDPNMATRNDALKNALEVDLVLLCSPTFWNRCSIAEAP